MYVQRASCIGSSMLVIAEDVEQHQIMCHSAEQGGPSKCVLTPRISHSSEAKNKALSACAIEHAPPGGMSSQN
ncbi:hypothetical protein AB1N83_006276 [Pleurotus pulmonarius]